MTIQEGYVLTELAGVPYLLPYGQNIAACSHGLGLNESGKLIWLAIAEGATKEETVQRLATHFDASAGELPRLEEDVEQFCGQLETLGILEPAFAAETFSMADASCFLIGGIRLQLHLPQELIAPEFAPFRISRTTEGAADLSVGISFSQPEKRSVGQVLLHSRELLLLETVTGFTLLFLDSPDIAECHVDKSGTRACFYCRKEKSDTLLLELFHGIRFAFLLCAQKKGIFAIHSASVLYQGKAWLFSAPSGTGKSTHAGHWNELFSTPLLNGDLNLLGIEHGQPVVYGLPWCGTSGIFTADTHPLGGVIFLQQHSSDLVQELSPDKQQLMLSQRLISPAWTREQLLTNLKFCGALAPNIQCFLLQCTKEASAAQVCKDAIDRGGTQRVKFEGACT